MAKRLMTVILLVIGICPLPAFAAEKALTEPVVIDVRSEAEWNAGHLEGAILIPHDRIEDEISKTVSDKKAKIYLYCHTGRRTALAYDALKKAGYEDLVNLETMEKASKALKRPIVK